MGFYTARHCPRGIERLQKGWALWGQLRWNAAPGLKITSGFWTSPRRTPSLLGPSETWIQDKRISATVWNSFTETRCSEAFGYGNLWGRSLADGVSKPQVLSNLNLLADAGLAVDTANPDPPLLAAVVRLTDQIPTLRVVIDHLPQLEPPRDATARTALQASLLELAKRPQVYAKMSEVLHALGGHVRHDLDFYRSRLDEIWDFFGPDRLLYGSDWPNSDHSAPLWQELRVVREYMESKGAVVSEKFFWRNSIAAYHWIKRAASQPASSAP